MSVSEKKSKNVFEYETNQLLRSIAIGLIVLVLFLSFPSYCTGECSHGHHDHDDHHHQHPEEPASFKWSREANVDHEQVHSHQEPPHSHDDHHHHHKHEKVTKKAEG